MTPTTQPLRLFILRLWPAASPDAPTALEWRGKVQSLPDGEAYYFRDWLGMIRHLETMPGVENKPSAGRALGRPMPVRTMQPGEPLPLLPETMAQLLPSMETGPDQFIDMSQASAVFGIEPTSLETFAARFFGGG